jgi:hypothetical protein
MIALSTCRRFRFAALALGTMAFGLLLQRIRSDLPPAAGDIMGDALWAMMIYWISGVAFPALPRWKRAATAILVCWGVELSQLYRAPWLDAWRGTTLGHLVLGTDFDPRDFLSYGLGVLFALALEPGLLSLRPIPRPQD